jgi:hypothetical protein
MLKFPEIQEIAKFLISLLKVLQNMAIKWKNKDRSFFLLAS